MTAGLQLRTEGKERHATWLELFYDLIYVVVIAKLTHLLAAPYGGLLTLQGYLVFTGLFVPVWWAWTGHTLFANRFDPDDALHRLLTLLQMGAVILMAVFIGGVGAGKDAGFALSYAAVRVVLLLMYLRIHLARPDLRFVSTLFLSGFSLGAGLWILSVFFDPPLMYVLWGAGLLVDMATPWAGQKILSKVSVHSSHLPERLGLFSIIILGEAVLGIVTGSKEVDWSGQ
ncbi:MAG TPA: low temperature requirement protein A, partial [Rhodospirillales bacterium]|nr:low temperature requirement protein A [Rhodospirillales bacterium]